MIIRFQTLVCTEPGARQCFTNIMRHRYCLDDLQIIRERDGCIIDPKDVPEKLTSSVKIPFTCRCGTPHEKVFWGLLASGGAYCTTCTREVATQKYKKTSANTKKRSSGEGPLVLRDQDGEVTDVELDTILPPVIAPGHLRPIMYDTMKHIPYVGVRYWDVETFTSRTKTWRLDRDEPEARASATAFLEALPHYEDTTEHVLKIRVDNVLKRRVFYERCFRLCPIVTQYEDRDVPCDPWVCAVWLGDGTARNCNFTNNDTEVIEGMRQYCDQNGLVMVKTTLPYQYNIKGSNGKRGSNTFLKFLQDCDMIGNKHIPDVFKYNSVKKRLELMAGILDTDGYLTGKSFEIAQSRENVFDDVREVAKSLGFKMTKAYKTATYRCDDGELREFPAWRGSIIGDITRIPMRVENKRCEARATQRHDLLSFKIEKRGSTT